MSEKTRRRNKRRWANPEYRKKSLTAAAQRRKAKGSADLKRARARLQRIVDDWKQQGCVDCGYLDIRAIDPDHRDSESKVNHLSRLVTLCASAARIRAELANAIRGVPVAIGAGRRNSVRTRGGSGTDCLPPGDSGLNSRTSTTGRNSLWDVQTAGGPNGPAAWTGITRVAPSTMASPN